MGIAASLLVIAALQVAPFGYEPVNPLARSRTPLAILAAPDGDAPQVTATFDIANSVEASWPLAGVRLDAEFYLWRVELWLPLTSKSWLYVRAAAGTVGEGVLDGLIDGWHQFLFGGRLQFPQRFYALNDTFTDEVDLPEAHAHGTAGGFLGDTKLGAAFRPTPWSLLALTLSVPTTSKQGRGLTTPALGTWARARFSPWQWLRFELSGGVGAASREGPLAAYQATFFAAAALDVEVLPHRDHAFFAQLWFHSPYYVATGRFALDDPDFSLRVGYRARIAGLFDVEAGITEDLSNGSALDVGFHLALRH